MRTGLCVAACFEQCCLSIHKVVSVFMFVLCQPLSFAKQTQLMLPFVTSVASFVMQEKSKDTRMNNLKQRISDDMKLQSRSAGEASHCARGIICSLHCKLKYISAARIIASCTIMPSQHTLTMSAKCDLRSHTNDSE